MGTVTIHLGLVSINVYDLTKPLVGASLDAKAQDIEYNKEVYPYTFGEFAKAVRGRAFGRPTRIAIVWGTTRHSPPECKHPAYVSDAMYIPELMQKLQQLDRNIHFHSYLDVDMSEKVLGECNLVLCGDGEVNYVVARLLSLVGEAVEIRYAEADKPYFMDKVSRVKHHMFGVVHLLRSPWNRDRFVIQFGGIGTAGTIASLKWLSDRLLDKPSLLPSSPFIVVKGEEKGYWPEFDGFENHCPYCCKDVELVDGVEKGRWSGKISNVSAVVQVYPPKYPK